MRVYHSHRAKGFTLVEIMIVVAIIALIAAIAIPNLLRARHNANETASISSMRTLVSALESFRANQTPVSYPGAGVTSGGTAVTGLGGLDDTVPAYIDPILASGQKQGYTFTFTPGPVRVVTLGGVAFNVYDTYTLTSAPVTVGTTGTRRFFVNETGVIRVNQTAAAAVTDPPID